MCVAVVVGSNEQKKDTSVPEEAYLGLLTDGSLCQFYGEHTDDETGATVAGYGRDAVPLSIAVPALIARHAGVNPVALPAMYDCIDTDALERIVEKGQHTDRDLTVTFRYAGYTVGIEGEQLSVRPVE